MNDVSFVYILGDAIANFNNVVCLHTPLCGFDAGQPNDSHNLLKMEKPAQAEAVGSLSNGYPD